MLEEWKERGKTIRLTIHGNSMMPLIGSGDGILLKLTTLENIAVGDVVAFIQNNDCIVHRAVKKKRHDGTWQFCQKGDNLSGWGWHDAQDLLGKVMCIEKPGKSIPMDGLRPSLTNRTIGITVWFVVTLRERLQPFTFLVKSARVKNNVVHSLKILTGIIDRVIRLFAEKTMNRNNSSK